MLSDRLKKLISCLDIKKGDFAEKIGFTQSYVSMVLNNSRSNPSERFFEAIVRAFNVNLDWLKYGTGEMFNIDENGLTPSEIELVKKINSLPLSERRSIENIIDAILLKNSIDSSHEELLETQSEIQSSNEKN